MSSWFGRTNATKKQQEIEDPLLTQQQQQVSFHDDFHDDNLDRTQYGQRDPEELDALWKQTRLPQKYRENIDDQELDAMASQADQEGRTLRNVIADRARKDRDEKEAKEFDETPEYRHTFQTATHKRGFQFNPWKYLAGLAFMTIGPCLLFMGIGLMFIGMYYWLPWITLLIVLVVAMLCCLLFLSGALSGDYMRTFLGLLFLIATITGLIAGMANYYDNLFHYWSASEGRQYTNVRSDSLAAAHADAGVMVFTDEAVIDTTKTIGYKSGNVYCVAPISRKDQTHASAIQYWAAGLDCCNGRGFFSCDDAADKAAKSGLVIRAFPASMLFKSELEYYMHAVEMSTEIYGLTSSKEPFFLRWTTDVGAKAESYLHAGWWTWILYGIIFLCINLVLACMFQGVIYQQKAKDSEAEKPKNNFAVGKGEKESLLTTSGPGSYKQGNKRWKYLDEDDPNLDPSEYVEPKKYDGSMSGIDTSTRPGQTERYADMGLNNMDNTNGSVETMHGPEDDPRYTEHLHDTLANTADPRYGNYGNDGNYQPNPYGDDANYQPNPHYGNQTMIANDRNFQSGQQQNYQQAQNFQSGQQQNFQSGQQQNYQQGPYGEATQARNFQPPTNMPRPYEERLSSQPSRYRE